MRKLGIGSTLMVHVESEVDYQSYQKQTNKQRTHTSL